MPSVSSNSKPGIHIAWKTVTYRSVALLVLAVLLMIFVGMRFAFPQFTENSIKAADGLGTKLLEVVAGAAGNPAKSGSAGAQQAHFTALDGTVRVKKANGNSWGTADYSIPLEKGDVVQTSSEGMAKIVFNDGTNYTVKQDSLIVIEENSTNDQQQTNVAVAVSTGTVDLATATYVQGSRSQVIVAGATASLAPDSAAMVHNDPKGDQHEILVKKGTGDITRNGETVRLADWEKVSFQAAEPHMDKLKEIGPPTPISPANMMPMFVSSDPKPIEFSWTPMANAKGYRLRISRNPYFSSTIVDRQSEYGRRPGFGPRARSLLLGGAIAGRGRQGIGRERKEPFYNYSEGWRHGGDQSGSGSADPAWSRDRVNGKDRGGGPGDGEWARSPGGRQRWRLPLLHAAVGDWGKHDHHYGAKC